MSDRKPAKEQGCEPLGSSFDNPVRLVMLSGGGAVGKTALIVRLLQDKMLDVINPTIEESFRWKSHDGVCVDITDTSGISEARPMVPSYVKNSHAIMLAFSVTDFWAFVELEAFYNEYLKERRGRKPLPFVLVGAKKDLESERKVTAQEAQEFAAKHTTCRTSRPAP